MEFLTFPAKYTYTINNEFKGQYYKGKCDFWTQL